MFALQAGITGTFNLGKVVLTEAAANTRLMYIFAPTTKYSLVINGTKFLNYYKIGLFLGNANTDIDLTVQNAIFNSTTTLGSGGNYYAIEADAVRNGNIVISGNTFTNYQPLTANSRTAISVVKSGDNSTVTVSNNTITDHISGGTLYGINLTGAGLTSSTFTVNGNNIIATSTGGIYYGIFANGTGAASVAPIIKNNTINLDGGGATSGSITGIHTEDVNSAISSNTIFATSTNAIVAGVSADAVSTILCNNIKVYSNNITISSPGSYGIIVGGEVTGARYTYLTNPQIYSNTVLFDQATTTTMHGIMFGYVKNGLGWNNYSSGADISYLIKGAASTTFYDNVAVNPISTGVSNAQAFRLKGASNGQYINNTLVNTNSTRSGQDVSEYSDADTAASTGTYNNNLSYSARDFLDYVFVGDSSVVTYANNDYYGSAYSFSYNGTAYSTISSWQSARELTASSTNPNFANINNSYSLFSNSPLIDAGTTNLLSSTTGDYLGNPIYGTPDIGAYEYQPPFRIGTSLVDPSGNIRIYGDGQYRYTTATSSGMTANLSATPVGGSWTYDASTTRPEWLNISNITWGSTKQWTASSSLATTTIFTVGDLAPNSTYQVTVDGIAGNNIASSSCSSGVCTSGPDGKLVLTYTGGYTTHTFAVAPIVATVTNTTVPLNNIPGGTASPSLLASILAPSASTTSYINSLTNPVPNCPIGFTCTPITQATSSSYKFTRALKLGMTGPDVKQLQIFLNSHGFAVSKAGGGSPGHETSYFGPATKSALMRFQSAHKKEILDPQGLAAPTGFFGEGTRGAVNGM